MKKFWKALKENRDDIRQKVLVAAGTVAAAVVAGVVFSKMENNRVDVIVIEESKPSEPVSDSTTED